jgi:glycosyltransferase involved in cell wall biosynthesis
VHFGDGDLMERIQNYARDKLSSKSNIRYDFKGFVENYEILNYYRTNPIDLFINTSDVEGIPYSIMEAFSFGIPAISRNVGGNAEIIENYVNGFLFNEYDSFIDISKRLKEYQEWSNDRKITMRLNALATYEYKYDAEKNYNNFFQDIVNLKTNYA